jgi:hypothetical protein
MLNLLQPQVQFDPLGIDARVNQNQLARLQNQSHILKNQQDQQTYADDQAARQALLASNGDAQALARGLQERGLLGAYNTQLKNNLELKTKEADITHKTALATQENATAGLRLTEDGIKKMQQHGEEAKNLGSHDDAVNWVVQAYNSPDLGALMKQGGKNLNFYLKNIPEDPAQLNQWKLNQATSSEKLAQFMSQKNIADAHDKTLKDNNTADNATRVKTTGMNNAATLGSANIHAKVQRDIAGLNPDGTVKAAGSPYQGLVDTIGRGDMTAQAALARVPPAVKSQIMEQVKQQYNDWTPDFAVTRVAAAKSFAAGGKDASAVEKGNTALNHIATIKDLAKAQAQNNIPLFNQIANRFAQETGKPAPTNMQAALTMVGPEISGAVIGAGGGVSDREKVDAALAAMKKGSPDQVLGTAQTIEDLFGGRLVEKQRSYERGTGKKDFTEPGRFLSPAAAAVLAKRKDVSQSTPTNTQRPALGDIFK